MAFASHYLDCLNVSRELDSYPLTNMLKSKTVMMPLLIIMEMKRRKSTTLQYNSYILNSILGSFPTRRRPWRTWILSSR